jgi:hypothetical protein
MNAKHALALACAAMCAAGLAEGATTQEQPGSSRLNPLSVEQGQGRELGIRQIARSFGISPEAARSRMNVEAHAPEIIERIRTQYADRLAGIYIEHQPTHRLVVRLTGFGAVQPEFYQFDNGRLGTDQLVVDYEVGAEHTFADLQKRFEAGFAGLQQRLPSLQSGYVDERTGQIVLEVVTDRPKLANGQRETAAHREAVADLAVKQQLADNYFGVATRVVPMGRLVNQAIQGSGNLDFVQGGAKLFCTGGFTVRTTTRPVTYGTLTAGHCQADTGIYNYQEAAGGTTTATLTHVARRFNAATDVGWSMISTTPADATNQFYTGSAIAGWQTQGTPLSKAGTAVGATLCHYGRTTTTGSCGTVASTAYNPGSICGPGLAPYTGTSACSAVYVAVDSVTCAQMDSGGPWYFIQLTPLQYRPAGIHKAGDPVAGRCVYSSTDDVFGFPLNLQLL